MLHGLLTYRSSRIPRRENCTSCLRRFSMQIAARATRAFTRLLYYEDRVRGRRVTLPINGRTVASQAHQTTFQPTEMHNPSSSRDERQAKGGREWLVPLLEPIAAALQSLNSPRSHMIYLAAQLCLDHLTGLAGRRSVNQSI